MTMTLYYAPGACSLADHIALKETGVDHELVKVDLKTKRTEDGRDFRAINAKGAVPDIERGGEVFTENAALLVMIAEESGKLLPPSGDARYRVLEATAFITTEVHKSFAPLFGGGSEEAKTAARETLAGKFAHLAEMLGDGDFLAGGALSIADCYAFVMTLWADNQKIELPASLAAYRDRLGQRPAFRAAMQAEGLA